MCLTFPRCLLIDRAGGILARHDPLSCCEETGFPHAPAPAHGSRASCLPLVRLSVPSLSPRELGQRDARCRRTSSVPDGDAPSSPPSSSPSRPDDAIAVLADVVLAVWTGRRRCRRRRRLRIRHRPGCLRTGCETTVEAADHRARRRRQVCERAYFRTAAQTPGAFERSPLPTSCAPIWLTAHGPT